VGSLVSMWMIKPRNPGYVLQIHEIGEIAGKGDLSIDLSDYGIMQEPYKSYYVEQLLTFYANHSHSGTKTHYLIRAYRKLAYNIVTKDDGEHYLYNSNVQNAHIIGSGGSFYEIERDEYGEIKLADIPITVNTPGGQASIYIQNLVHNNAIIDPTPNIVLKIENKLTVVVCIDNISQG